MHKEIAEFSESLVSAPIEVTGSLLAPISTTGSQIIQPTVELASGLAGGLVGTGSQLITTTIGQVGTSGGILSGITGGGGISIFKIVLIGGLAFLLIRMVRSG